MLNYICDIVQLTGDEWKNGPGYAAIIIINLLFIVHYDLNLIYKYAALFQMVKVLESCGTDIIISNQHDGNMVVLRSGISVLSGSALYI